MVSALVWPAAAWLLTKGWLDGVSFIAFWSYLGATPFLLAVAYWGSKGQRERVRPVWWLLSGWLVQVPLTLLWGL
ncbi:MAG: hypothetical protein L0Y66_26975 [Myxococcaceae bacterium]|nr:hypothetical protein [Myxococcaceae bacterium]MCI0671562.1 hypothetical protein [Myxococcaceae bacterium]